MRKVAVFAPALAVTLAVLTPAGVASAAPEPDLIPTVITVDRPGSPALPLETGIDYLSGSNSPPLVVNSPVHFESGVRNTGDASTGPFAVKWYVDGEEVGAHGGHTGLGANSQVLDGNSGFTWTFARSGAHVVTFHVDSDGHVAESGEGNNLISLFVWVDSDVGAPPGTFVPPDPERVGEVVFCAADLSPPSKVLKIGSRVQTRKGAVYELVEVVRRGGTVVGLLALAESGENDLRAAAYAVWEIVGTDCVDVVGRIIAPNGVGELVPPGPGDPIPQPRPTPLQGDVPADLLGSWSGSVTQLGHARSPYPVQVRVEPGAVGATVAQGGYPGLGCRVHWTLLQAAPTRIVVRETVDEGLDCLDVDITLEYDAADDTLTYTFDGGSGRAVLERDG